MLFILPLATYSFLLLQALVIASPVPRYFQSNPITRRDLTAETVEKELGPLLSSGTLIFGPENPAYVNATSRWITFVQPDIEVVVEPAAESDISKIVSSTSRLSGAADLLMPDVRRSSIAMITASNSSRETADTG